MFLFEVHHTCMLLGDFYLNVSASNMVSTHIETVKISVEEPVRSTTIDEYEAVVAVNSTVQFKVSSGSAMYAKKFYWKVS